MKNSIKQFISDLGNTDKDDYTQCYQLIKKYWVIFILMTPIIIFFKILLLYPLYYFFDYNIFIIYFYYSIGSFVNNIYKNTKQKLSK